MDKLWNIIGVHGCLLSEYEKIQIVQILAEAVYECEKYSSLLFEIFQDFENSDYNFSILDYTNCKVTSKDRDKFNEAFDFTLSKTECWEAISKISTFEHNNEIFKMSNKEKKPNPPEHLDKEHSDTTHTNKEKSDRPKHTRQDEE